MGNIFSFLLLWKYSYSVEAYWVLCALSNSVLPAARLSEGTFGEYTRRCTYRNTWTMLLRVASYRVSESTTQSGTCLLLGSRLKVSNRELPQVSISRLKPGPVKKSWFDIMVHLESQRISSRFYRRNLVITSRPRIHLDSLQLHRSSFVSIVSNVLSAPSMNSNVLTKAVPAPSWLLPGRICRRSKLRDSLCKRASIHTGPLGPRHCSRSPSRVTSTVSSPKRVSSIILFSEACKNCF